VQKDTDDLTDIFALFGSAHAKAASKMLVKFTPSVSASDKIFKRTKSININNTK